MSFFTIRKISLAAALAGGSLLAQPAAPTPPPPPRVMVWTGAMPSSYVGIGFVDVTTERVKALKLSEERGIEVTKVVEDSPAAKAGLKVGDVILEYNGQRVEGQETFMRFVRDTPPNREVNLVISRDGQNQNLSLTTAARKKMVPGKNEQVRIEIPRMEIPDIESFDMPRPNMSWRSGMLGVEAEGIDGPFAEFFGVKEGVLVRGVGKDTAAAKAGLKPGDVITKVDDSPVTTPRQITSKLRADRDKKTFTITLVRDKREMSMGVTLDSPADSSPKGRSVKQ